MTDELAMNYHDALEKQEEVSSDCPNCGRNRPRRRNQSQTSAEAAAQVAQATSAPPPPPRAPRTRGPVAARPSDPVVPPQPASSPLASTHGTTDPSEASVLSKKLQLEIDHAKKMIRQL